MSNPFSNQSKSVFDASVARVLLEGGVVVMPTDTIYGICVNAAYPEVVERLYKLKSRELKPGTLIAASVEQLVELGIKYEHLARVEHLWPAPVSVIVPVENGFSYIDQGLKSLAVRVVDDPSLIKLLEQTGPLVTTSANLPDLPPANTVDEAKAYFGDKIDMYVDGGDRSNAKASTIVRLHDDKIEILRQGSVVITRREDSPNDI
jgi:L-threonylcarbamoyladenylate synthase